MSGESVSGKWISSGTILVCQISCLNANLTGIIDRHRERTNKNKKIPPFNAIRGAIETRD